MNTVIESTELKVYCPQCGDKLGTVTIVADNNSSLTTLAKRVRSAQCYECFQEYRKALAEVRR